MPMYSQAVIYYPDNDTDMKNIQKIIAKFHCTAASDYTKSLPDEQQSLALTLSLICMQEKQSTKARP